MIYLYTGTPGSGKSLDTARVIRGRLALKKPVICNFPINKKGVKHSDLFVYKKNTDLTPEYLMNYAREYFGKSKVKEGTITLVIDEAQMLFNSRDWSKPDRARWNEFFQVHRHFGYDIILATQFDSMIDKQIRALVEYEVKHRKVSNYGIKGLFIQALFLAPTLFCRISIWYPVKQKMGSNFYRGNKKLYKLYDTFALSFVEEKQSGE